MVFSLIISLVISGEVSTLVIIVLVKASAQSAAFGKCSIDLNILTNNFGFEKHCFLPERLITLIRERSASSMVVNTFLHFLHVLRRHTRGIFFVVLEFFTLVWGELQNKQIMYIYCHYANKKASG